jgi:hypothetical protein
MGSGYTDTRILELELVGGEWSASRPSRISPGERSSSTRRVGGWMGPRTGLDDVEKRKIMPSPGLELGLFSHPAQGQSLY